MTCREARQINIARFGDPSLCILKQFMFFCHVSLLKYSMIYRLSSSQSNNSNREQVAEQLVSTVLFVYRPLPATQRNVRFFSGKRQSKQINFSLFQSSFTCKFIYDYHKMSTVFTDQAIYVKSTLGPATLKGHYHEHHIKSQKPKDIFTSMET